MKVLSEDEEKLFLQMYSEQDLPGLIETSDGKKHIYYKNKKGKIAVREYTGQMPDFKMLKTTKQKDRERKTRHKRIGAAIAAGVIAAGVGIGAHANLRKNSSNNDNISTTETAEKYTAPEEKGTAFVKKSDGSVEAVLSSGVEGISDINIYENGNGWFMYLSSMLNVSKEMTAYVNGLLEEYNVDHQKDGKKIDYVQVPEYLLAAIIDVESSAKVADPRVEHQSSPEQEEICIGPTGLSVGAINDNKTQKVIEQLRSVGLDEDLIITDYSQRNDIYPSAFYATLLLEVVIPSYLNDPTPENIISAYNYGHFNVNKGTFKTGYSDAVRNVYEVAKEAANRTEKPSRYWWAEMSEARKGADEAIQGRKPDSWQLD